MVTNVNWRATWIVVALFVVLGLVLGIPLSYGVGLWISEAATTRTATEMAGLVTAVNLGLACVLSLLYGAGIAATYVWLAARGATLPGGEAVTGALVTFGLYLVISGAIGICLSATGTMLSLQQVGPGLGPVEVGQVFGALLVSSLLQGLVRLIAGGLATVPAALLTARLVKRG